jgi:hypothetical protein
MKNLPNQPLQASIATKEDVKQKTVSAGSKFEFLLRRRARFDWLDHASKKMKNVINKVFFGLEKVVETWVRNKMKH